MLGWHRRFIAWRFSRYAINSRSCSGKRLPGCPEVNGLITFGSPLAIDGVQDRLKPEWTQADGFPAQVGRWVIVYDRFDVACGLDPLLSKDFGCYNAHVVEDLHVPNKGSWRHTASKYLGGGGVKKALEEMVNG